MAHTLDVYELTRVVNEERVKQQLTWAVLAETVGVNVRTLSEMRKGHQPHAAILVRLLVWLGDSDLGPYIKEV